MVHPAALLSLASLTTELATGDTSPDRSSRGAVAVGIVAEDPVNRNLDITECLRVAMRKCHGDIEQARVSEDKLTLQKGLAAEEILKLLGRMIDLRWSSVLKAEVEEVLIANTEGLDLKQRMDLAWKNSLIAKMSKAEVYIKKFIETLVIVDATAPLASHNPEATPVSFALPSEDSKIHALPIDSSPEEGVAAIDLDETEGSERLELFTPVRPAKPHVLKPLLPLHHHETASNATDVEEGSSQLDTKDAADALNKMAHRKLKPPMNGIMIPTHLTDLDVPRGRGGVINRHPGHQYLLSRVCSYRDRYKAAKRGEKELLAKELVRAVQERNGRFLDYFVDPNGQKTWYEINDEAAVKVVQQKLRELPMRVKDKWKSTTTSDTDAASAQLDDGDNPKPTGKKRNPSAATNQAKHGKPERKAKGEHDAALMLLSL